MGIEAMTIYIDESIARDRRKRIANLMRARKGVRAVVHYDEKPQLMLIEYNPYAATPHELLLVVLEQGLRAELIGL